MIKLGEIVKLKKDDKVPHLEITIEIENDRIHSNSQFIYLHQVDEISNDQEIKDERLYNVERLEWAENIGKCYIKLDFDRRKK